MLNWESNSGRVNTFFMSAYTKMNHTPEHPNTSLLLGIPIRILPILINDQSVEAHSSRMAFSKGHFLRPEASLKKKSEVLSKNFCIITFRMYLRICRTKLAKLLASSKVVKQVS
jgi:hypothetical protein